MCRLLYVRSAAEFAIGDHLRPFARLSRDSNEYQGHGWGCAYRRAGAWELHRDLRPVWEDDVDRFGRTTLLVAHARSAFEGSEVRVENNMPFHDGRWIFAFNGELRGVRIREEGRIGAEKVFNYIKRFAAAGMLEALQRAVPILERQSVHVRAMNILIADDRHAYLATRFNEDPEYFTMRRKEQDGLLALCSEPYPGEHGWRPIADGTIEVY